MMKVLDGMAVTKNKSTQEQTKEIEQLKNEIVRINGTLSFIHSQLIDLHQDDVKMLKLLQRLNDMKQNKKGV